MPSNLTTWLKPLYSIQAMLTKQLFLSAAAIICLNACHNDKKTDNSAIVKGFEISETMLKSTSFAAVKKENITEELNFFGKISADQNNYIDIFPLVGGNVVSVNVSLGDYVHKGQVLATIRSTEVAGIQKDLSDAKTDVLLAEKNYRVAEDMYNGKLSTDKDMLEAKGQLTKAKEQLRRSEAVSQIYNVRTGNLYSVVSPIDGYIVQKNINKDMQLRSDRSDNIFDVANTKDVWAILNVNETDIEKISMGMPAIVSTLSYPDKKFEGSIDKIFKIIDPQTNAMQARVVLDNKNGLLIPDSKATIKVLHHSNTQALAIPSDAVIFDQNKYFVLVYKSQNDIKIHEIQPLKQNEETTYISAGLQEGEQVIVDNKLLIYRALNN